MEDLKEAFSMALCSFRDGLIFKCKLKFGNLAPLVRISLLGKILFHSLLRFLLLLPPAVADNDADVGEDGLDDEAMFFENEYMLPSNLSSSLNYLDSISKSSQDYQLESATSGSSTFPKELFDYSTG